MPSSGDHVRSHLLVTDARIADLERVRADAARHGWDVELQRLDGTAPHERGEGWFPEILRLHLVARDGAEPVDAALLVPSSPGLALDTLGRRLD